MGAVQEGIVVLELARAIGQSEADAGRFQNGVWCLRKSFCSAGDWGYGDTYMYIPRVWVLDWTGAEGGITTWVVEFGNLRGWL